MGPFCHAMARDRAASAAPLRRSSATGPSEAALAAAAALKKKKKTKGGAPGAAAAAAAAAAASAPLGPLQPGVPHSLALMARQLRLRADQAARPELLPLLRDMLDPASLPPGWSVYADAKTGRPFYYSPAQALSLWRHPEAAFYQGAVFMALGGSAAIAAAQRSDPPSAADVSAMRDYFGIGVAEPDPIQEVARMAVAAPLPRGWEEVWEGPDRHFFRERGGAHPERLQLEHPLDGYFAGLLRRRRAVR